MDRKIRIQAAKACNKMIFESADGSFSSIASMNPRWYKLEVDVISMHELFELGRAFVIKLLETGL